MASTSLVNKIGIHATAETALPTLPGSSGSNIASWSGWSTLGSVSSQSDTADLDADSIDFDFVTEIAKIQAPRDLAVQERIMLQNYIDGFSFVCHDASEALLTLASHVSISSNQMTFSGTLTNRTIAIEVNGYFVDYFPSCAVF